MLDLGGIYEFHEGFDLLFAAGRSIYGQPETYTYLSLYWTWGPRGADKDKPPTKMLNARHRYKMLAALTNSPTAVAAPISECHLKRKGLGICFRSAQIQKGLAPWNIDPPRTRSPPSTECSSAASSLMALFGAIRLCSSSTQSAATPTPLSPRWQSFYLIAMVALGWAAVLTGAYIIYPWYRAVAPAGADLALYPKFLLTAHPTTAGWHTLGMEWKEHVAWIAPMAATMVAWVMLKHRAAWNAHRQVRTTVLGFAAAAFLAAAIAGGWGAMINKKAPVQGAKPIQLMGSAK